MGAKNGREWDIAAGRASNRTEMQEQKKNNKIQASVHVRYNRINKKAGHPPTRPATKMLSSYERVNPRIETISEVINVLGPGETPETSCIEYTDSPASPKTVHIDSQTLRRSLSVWDGLGVIIGIQIGSGIFASAGVALAEAGSCSTALVAWTCSAVLVHQRVCLST